MTTHTASKVRWYDRLFAKAERTIEITYQENKTKQMVFRRCNDILREKYRYNRMYDTTLFDEAWQYAEDRRYMVYAKGIAIQKAERLNVDNTDYKFLTLYNPYAVYMLDTRVCTVISDMDSNATLFVDDDYMKLSDNAKTFFRYQAKGHIIYGHSQFNTDADHQLMQQVEADEYANSFAYGHSAILEARKLTERNSVIWNEFTERLGRI